MLRYSVQALPAEIYDMIYSHLSLNHLATLQRTCRLLFRVTCPYVWRSVDIESLLQLFPGCNKEVGKVPKLEIATPSPIPPEYFDRFLYYARFVKCIKITPNFTISGSFEEDLSELALLASTKGPLILPFLHTAHLAMLDNPQHFRDEYADYKFWINALIPDSIRYISFQAIWNDDESLLEALISKAPRLTRLELAIPPEERTPSFYKQIFSSDKMRHLQHLRYTGSIVDSDFLSWLGELAQLTTLELFVDPCDTEELPSLPEVTFPSSAFRGLTTLEVYTSDHGDIDDECNLLKQLWAMPLVGCLTSIKIKFSGPVYPGMKQFEQLMALLTVRSPNVSSILLEASGQPNHFPEIAVELLSGASQLPLHTLGVQSPFHIGAEELLFKSLGGAFAKIEDLDVSSTTVEIVDLLSAHRYLTRLRYLNIGLWKTKMDKRRLQSVLLSKNKVAFVCPTQPPCGSSLSISFRERKSIPRVHAYNLDFHDVDILAILLAARWADIRTHGDLLSDRMSALRTRIDVWRGRAVRDWAKVTNSLTRMLNRSSGRQQK